MAFPAELAARFTQAADIGGGALGRVYRATDRTSGRAVAVRVVDPVLCLDPEMRHQFAAEARAAGRVKHPNLVEILDSGETADGLSWVATELVDGASLAKILEREKRLAPPKVIGLGRALLAGLAALHDAGVVHRSLRPTNVLLDRAGQLKIADYGIARETAARLARVRGTPIAEAPHHRAPEQLTNGRIAPATDVYAAGALMYTALAGRPPITGESESAVTAAQLAEQPPSLESLVPEIPKALARVVHRMLSVDPGERYADAKVSLSALKTASGDRSEAVRTLTAAGANEPGESLVPMRFTANKIPAHEPPSVQPPAPPRAFANPPPELERMPERPPPRVDEGGYGDDQGPPSLMSTDAPAKLAIAISMLLVVLVTLIALVIRVLR